MDTIPEHCASTPHEPDVFLDGCFAREAMTRLGGKWTVLVIKALGPQERMRFGELRRKLDGITQKMLTQTLRDLERDGMVNRLVYPTMPPRVEYSLTKLGLSTVDLIEAICDWAEQHSEEVRLARIAFDERATREVLPVIA